MLVLCPLQLREDSLGIEQETPTVGSVCCFVVVKVYTAGKKKKTKFKAIFILTVSFSPLSRLELSLLTVINPEIEVCCYLALN